MGYDSFYNLTIYTTNKHDKPKPMPSLLQAKIIKDLLEECTEPAFDENGHGLDWYTWYDYKYEIAQFSARHPTLLFIVDREGEDQEREYTIFRAGYYLSEFAETLYPSPKNLYRRIQGNTISPFSKRDARRLLVDRIPRIASTFKPREQPTE